MSEIVTAAWRRYLQQLQAHPLRTKVASFCPFLPARSAAIESKVASFEAVTLFNFRGLSRSLAGHHFGGFGRMQRCDRSEDLRGEEAPVEKDASAYGDAFEIPNFVFIVWSKDFFQVFWSFLNF